MKYYELRDNEYVIGLSRVSGIEISKERYYKVLELMSVPTQDGFINRIMIDDLSLVKLPVTIKDESMRKIDDNDFVDESEIDNYLKGFGL